jgi:hypothetical protein
MYQQKMVMLVKNPKKNKFVLKKYIFYSFKIYITKSQDFFTLSRSLTSVSEKLVNIFLKKNSYSLTLFSPFQHHGIRVKKIG